MVSNVVVLFIMVHLARAFPNGAPAEACVGLFPTGHNTDAQTLASPFNITLSASTFKCNEDITVTLGGSIPFKGFLCQPRPAVDVYVTSGRLTASGTTPMKQGDCGANAALTHKNASPKNSAEFKWTPPTAMAEKKPIYIVCTVVKEKLEFWQRISSTAITYDPGSECPTSEASHVTYALLPILTCPLLWVISVFRTT